MKIHGDGVQKFQNLHNEQISIMYKKQTNKKPHQFQKKNCIKHYTDYTNLDSV